MWIYDDALRKALSPSSGLVAVCDLCWELFKTGQIKPADVRSSPLPGVGVWADWQSVGQLHWCPQHLPPSSDLDDLTACEQPPQGYLPLVSVSRYPQPQELQEWGGQLQNASAGLLAAPGKPFISGQG